MLEEGVRSLAKRNSIAVLSTILPGGQPQSQVVWADADDEHVIVNTVVTHQKFKNVRRDPRATLTLVDPDNPHHYAEVRGHVVETVQGPVARAHLDELAMKYNGRPYEREVTADRVILKIAPDRQRVQGR